MTTSSPMTDADLNAIERGIEDGDLTHGQTHQLIAEVRRQRAVLDQVDASTRHVEAALERVAEQNAQLLTALAHLDKIINAYQSTNALGPMLIAIREAKEWRGIKTSQDAPGATQST